MSRTSTSTRASKKSCWRWTTFKLAMAPSCLATALVRLASALVLLLAMTLMRPVNFCAFGVPCGEVGEVPVDIDEAFRRGGEGFQRGAVLGMDGDAFAGGDDADDFIAGQRVAAAGVMHIHAGDQAGDAACRSRPCGAGVARRAGGKRLAHEGRQHARRAGRAQFRIGGVDHFLRPECAGGDRDVEIVQRWPVSALWRPASRIFSEPSTPSWRKALASADLPASRCWSRICWREEAADAGARLAGDDEAFPGRRRRAAAGGENFHLVAVLQFVAQRHQPAVDAGADAGIADLAMHGIGEIHRGGAARQLDQLAFRREAEHLVLVEFELGVFQKFVRRRGVLENFEQILHPAELFADRPGCASACL